MKKNYLPLPQTSFFLYPGRLHANSQERLFRECATFLQWGDQMWLCIHIPGQNSTNPYFYLSCTAQVNGDYQLTRDVEKQLKK